MISVYLGDNYLFLYYFHPVEDRFDPTLYTFMTFLDKKCETFITSAFGQFQIIPSSIHCMKSQDAKGQVVP